MKTLQKIDERHYKLRTFHGNQYVTVDVKAYKKAPSIPTLKLIILAILMLTIIGLRLLTPITPTKIESPLPANQTLLK